MSPQLGKLGTRHRGPFSRKICICPQVTEGSGTYARSPDWVFCGRLLPDVIFCQGEHWGCLCLFMQTTNGPDLSLAYSFSLLVAGTA